MNILQTLLGILFLFVGIPKLFRLQVHRDLFKKYGYPLWLLLIVGLVEASGGVLILLGTYVEGIEGLLIAGGAFIVMDMISVTITHLRAREWLVVPVPVVLMFVVALISISAF